MTHAPSQSESAPIDFAQHEGDLITHYATLINGIHFGVTVAGLASFTLIMAINTAFVASSELMERGEERYRFRWRIAANRRQSLYRIHLSQCHFFLRNYPYHSGKPKDLSRYASQPYRARYFLKSTTGRFNETCLI